MKKAHLAIEDVATVSTRALREAKQHGEKITSLTVYDAAFASVLEAEKVDIALVGDSLGMVVQGRANTVQVTLDEIIYHAQLVARGLKRTLLMVDMPFMSYHSPEVALHNAARLVRECGAHMLKLEWGALQLPMVQRLSECGISVCAHLGLTPQSVHKMGGYRVQGREETVAEQMRADAERLEQAGADLLLLECVPSSLAAQITERVSIPVIGIGAGAATDGQVLVLYDILGISPGKRTRFSKDYIRDTGSVQAAVARYVQEVRTGTFPTAEHSFS